MSGVKFWAFKHKKSPLLLKINSKGFSHLELVVIAFIVAVTTLAGFAVYNNIQNKSMADSDLSIDGSCDFGQGEYFATSGDLSANSNALKDCVIRQCQPNCPPSILNQTDQYWQQQTKNMINDYQLTSKIDSAEPVPQLVAKASSSTVKKAQESDQDVVLLTDDEQAQLNNDTFYDINGVSMRQANDSGAVGRFRYYDQCDSRWGSKPYGKGKSLICASGCGITSTAMALSSLLRASVKPDILAMQYGKRYHNPAVGTMNTLYHRAAKDYGLRYKDLGTNLGAARTVVNSGGFVIASFGKGDFTSTGHIMIIQKTRGKNFILADPNRTKNIKQKKLDTRKRAYSERYLKNNANLNHLWAIY